MKKFQIGMLLAVLTVFSPGFTVNEANPDAIIGLYWSPKKDAKIEIFKRGSTYYGRSVWVATPRKDTENPKEALKTREVLGIELLYGFSFNNGIYSEGEIYDPETGKTYSCKMSLEGNRLKVRGYIGISLLGRTEYFEKIK